MNKQRLQPYNVIYCLKSYTLGNSWPIMISSDKSSHGNTETETGEERS